MPSGSKRSHDGEDRYSSTKRTRGDSRDRRDTHEKSRGGSHHEKGSGSGHRGHSRDRDRERNGDRYDRRRDRDHRDRSRSRSRRRNGHRSESPRRSSRASERRSEKQRERNEKDRPRVKGEESEKEEGEISPPSRESTAPPSVTSTLQKPTSPPEQPKPTEPEPELELATTPPPAEMSLEARRARRQAILAKYKDQVNGNGVTANGTSPYSGPPSSAVQQPHITSFVSDPVSQNHNAIDTRTSTPVASAVDPSRLATPIADSPMADSFSLAKGQESSDVRHQADAQNGEGEQVSAADYDPSLDRREDEQKRVRGSGEEQAEEVEEEVEEVEEEDVDDMFSLTTTDKHKKTVKKVVKRAAPALITTTLDSAADPEGYYQIILGEQLDNARYQVFSSLGKGMFANVVRARVLQGDFGEAGKEVAIKIVRCQESMYKAGLKEAQILQKLIQADPDDKKHVVRLERTFEHRGHLCLVFESLSMNLRDVVKRFGKDVGLNIRAVRAYAHQLFLAMSLLRKCNVMHADIKPDNILVNEHKTVLKLCDLGSASDASENEITPYLVSRFYRAPEIILGVPYDCALDIWSIGCTLYELYTGKILFPGRSNNHMLLLMMELKGRFNSKMIKKAKFGEQYFDEMGGFDSIEKERVTGTDIIRKVHISKPVRDLRARLLPTASKVNDDEFKLISSFTDLLDKCLMLDPARRITPKEALVHPFIRG